MAGRFEGLSDQSLQLFEDMFPLRSQKSVAEECLMPHIAMY
jgi:hypothetical protein